MELSGVMIRTNSTWFESHTRDLDLVSFSWSI